MKYNSTKPYAETKYSYPVVMVPGISHASFLSGVPPSAVQNTDLRATVSNDEAVESVSDVVSSFLKITRWGKDNQTASVKVLDHYIDDLTAPVMEPILDIWKWEGAPFLSSFNNSSPWVADAQRYVASTAVQNSEIEFDDEYKTFTAVSGEFSHAKPTISKSGAGYVDKSYSHSSYQWKTIHGLDAADYQMAYELGAKFKSREAIYKEINVPFEAGSEATCKEINQRAIDFVK